MSFDTIYKVSKRFMLGIKVEKAEAPVPIVYVLDTTQHEEDADGISCKIVGLYNIHNITAIENNLLGYMNDAEYEVMRHICEAEDIKWRFELV